MNPFQIAQPWVSQILHTIKKELRQEHLAKSPAFHKAHFGNRPLQRLTNEEIFTVYEAELLKGTTQELEEWVVNRWVFRHGDIYEVFLASLSEINPNFESIQEITDEQSEKILERALEKFDPLSVYLFSVLNRVVFSSEIFKKLREKAELHEARLSQEKELLAKQEKALQEKISYEAELARLEKKYEDKLSGIMRKYQTDIEAMKNQIRALQKRVPVNA